MAFSYSDKNFTVIGNLCFVHIVVDNKDAFYEIPPAISDRMLVNKIYWAYISYDVDDSSIGQVIITKNNISCTAQFDNGYLMAYFPIDSNK